MVVVVPAFTEREDRQQPVVAAGVTSLVALAAKHVGERIDGVGGVPAEHRRDDEAPHQHLPAGGAQARRHVVQDHAQQEHGDAQQHRHKNIVAVEPAQFREFHQVADQLEIGRKALDRQEPAGVRTPEAMLGRRVHVGGAVRVGVVVAVMRGPPDRPALYRRSAQQPEHELTRARGFEGAVRKITVIEAGDREHAHQIGADGHAYGHRTDPGPDCRQAGEVHQQERNAARPVDPVRHGLARRGDIQPARIQEPGHGVADACGQAEGGVFVGSGHQCPQGRDRDRRTVK